jgi:DNA repair exonuclease SbcCD nuclease subunit
MLDTYEKLELGISDIETIMHIADVHVRLIKRHDEYREAFSKVYTYAKKNLPKNSVILIAGDLGHSKIDMSPESVQLTSEFLKNLSDIRPTILISGNHDCLLTNKTRLDSLSPIVDNLDHENLFYLKKTGLYGVGSVLFNNMSVFDEMPHYLDIRKLTKKLKSEFETKIALFHGGVHGSLTDMGYVIENKIVPRDFFDGHDIVMLGDIHKEQTFYIEKVVEEADLEEYMDSGEWEIVEEFEQNS